MLIVSNGFKTLYLVQNPYEFGNLFTLSCYIWFMKYSEVRRISNKYGGNYHMTVFLLFHQDISIS